jgi:membrane protease YdiL (CAAX protease family)
MAVNLTPFVIVLTLIVCAICFAMMVALAWVCVRVVLGEPLLPITPARPRRVPWGWRSVVAVVALYFVINFLVVDAYKVLKRHGFHVGPPPAAAAKAKPEAAPGTPKPATTALAKTPRADDPKGAAKEEHDLSFTELMFLVSVVNIVVIVTIPGLIRVTSGATARDLGLSTETLGRDVAIGLVAFLVVTPAVIAINALAVLVWPPTSHPLEGMLRESLATRGIVLAYVSAVVLAPVAEELLFRGIIQGWLNRLLPTDKAPAPEVAGPDACTEAVVEPETDLGLVVPNPSVPVQIPRTLWLSPSILLTSFFFALVHAPQMPAPIAIFFLSLALGWLYNATGSLVPSTVLHAMFNGFNTTLMVVALSVLGPKDIKEKKLEPPPPAENQNRVEQRVFDWRAGVGLIFIH